MEYELDAKTESDDSRVSAPGISHNTIISRRANNYTFRTITDHLNGNLTLRYQRKCFNKVMFGKSNTIVCSTSADLTQSLKSFKCAVVGSKSEKGGTADMKEFFLEMDKEASTKHESCISYFEECKMQTTAVESEQNFSQKVAKCNKKCEILSPKKSSSKPKVLYSQKMSKLPSDFNSEDQFSHFFVGLDDIEDARLSDFKIPPNKNKNQPEDTNKNIERNQTFSSSSGVNGVTSAASPIQVAESCMARYKGSRIKFPGVKAGPAPKCVKLKRIMYLQSGFTSKHIFMPPTHKLHNSPCSLHGDKTSFYWKWNLGMKQCVIWPQLGGCVFKRNVLKRKLDKTKQWKTNLREMLPIIKGILSTKMVQCKKSDQDIQFDRNPAISKRKIYDFRLPNENGKMCVSNKEIIVDNDKIGKVNHINHYTRSASSTNKNKYHLERQLIGRSSRKPIDCRTAKWSRNIRKEKHKQIETVKRNTVKEMSVSARKRTSNVITRKRTVNGGNLQCKFQNKHARFGNEVVYSGKTGTSLKHIIGIPEGKERSVNKKFLHEAVQARRQKLLKDCYNTLIESSSQSQRHIAELLEQEIESEYELLQFGDINETLECKQTDNAEVEEIKLLKDKSNFFVSGNECDSHLRTHFDELGAEGTRSISSHEKGIEELGITLTTHNSPSFSVASNSTVKKFSVSSILSGTMMNESSTVINESYKKVDQAIIDYCPHRSTSSYKIRHGWKRKLHSLVACDASETKKTKVCQDSVSGLLEEQVGCEAFLQPTLKTGSVNCSEASLNKEKSTHSKRYRNGHKKQSDIPTDNKGTEECTFASNFGHDTVNRICTEKSVDEVTVQNSDPQVCDISQTINQMTGKVHKTTENTDLKGHLVKMDLGTCTTSSGSDFTMDILKNKHFKITDLLSVKNVNVLQSAEKEDEVTSHESDAVFPGGGGSDGFPSTSCGESVLIPPMKMPESNTENFDESEVETMVSKSLSDSDNGDVLSIYASSLDGMDSDVEFECQHNSEYQKLQTTESDISQESTVEMWNDNVYNTSKDKFCVDDLTINECDTSAISGSSKNRWHLTTSHNCNKKFRANCRLEDEAPNTRDQISSSDKIIGIPEPVKQDFLTSVGQCSEECNLPENNNQPVAENYSRNSLSPVTSQTSNKPKKIITLKKKLEDSSFFSERVHNTFKFRRVGRKGKTCNSKNYRKNILGYSPPPINLLAGHSYHVNKNQQIYPQERKSSEGDYSVSGLKLPVSAHQDQRNKSDVIISKPALAVNFKYCFNFIHLGICYLPACNFQHEMTQELENYLGLLILHYITSGWEDYAWILINIHTANCINSSLCISLLWPLARHIVQVDNLTVLSNIKVPSHLTSALDIARVGVLCELHRGYAAYSLFQNNFSSASSFAMHTMIGIFVRYCENCPEKEATSPWEKILLWKYEPFGSPFKEQRKDMFNIGWLKVRINARDVDKVCEAYNHLCKELFAPSSFFIYITCCAVTFLNEMGERKKSFHVLKEVRRLKANDESIFTALIPTDKESGMCLLSELSELGHLVCERRVPLSASTWDRLISFIMTFSNLTLTIDLLICAMQIKKFKPEVETLKKLLLDCSRGGPALMQPLSKLVCALSADYLCRMRSSLEYLVNFFADAPPPEQQVKNIIIRHCQTHGINLVLHSQVSAYKRKSESSIYDRSTENRLQCSFKVHNKDNFIAQFRNLSTSHFGVPNMDASSQNLPNLENLRLSSDFRYQSSSICYSSPQKILLKSRSCSGDTYSLASRTTDSRILVCDNQDDQSVLLNHASKHHLSTSCWGQYHERPNSEHENLPSVLVNEGANSRKLTQYMNKGRIELNEPANDWKIIIVPQYKKSFGYSQTSVQNKCSKLMPIYDQSQKQSLCRGPLLDVSFPILGHVSAPLNSMLPTSRIQRHFDKPSRLTGRSPKHDLTKKILCERKSECKLNPCQHKQSCLSHDTAGGLQLHKGIHQCSEEYIRLQDSSNELSINNSSPFFHTEKILVSNVQPKPWCSSAHQSSFLKQKPGMSSKLSSSVRDKIDLTTQKRAKASAKNVKEPLCHTATVSNINNEHLSQRCSFVCVTKENCALQSTVSQSDLKQKLTTMPEPWASPREESTILSLTSDLIIDVEGCLLSPKAGSSEVTYPMNKLTQNNERMQQPQEELKAHATSLTIKGPHEANINDFVSGYSNEFRAMVKDFGLVNLDPRHITPRDSNSEARMNNSSQICGSGNVITYNQNPRGARIDMSNITGANSVQLIARGCEAASHIRNNVETSEVSQDKNIILHYGRRDRYGSGFTTTSYKKRKRRKPWKGSKRPLLCHIPN